MTGQSCRSAIEFRCTTAVPPAEPGGAVWAARSLIAGTLKSCGRERNTIRRPQEAVHTASPTRDLDDARTHCVPVQRERIPPAAQTDHSLVSYLLRVARGFACALDSGAEHVSPVDLMLKRVEGE
jgi:hypothetical protein